MKTMFAIGTLALVLSASLAAALDPVTIPGSAAGGSDVYVVVDENGPGASVWEESNGLAGLQTSVTVTEDGREIPADTQTA
jgi:hypothetical protein